MAIVVEHLHRGGQVLQSFKVDKDVCTVGRSFECDVLLHDEHIDAHHLTITQDIESHSLYCEDQQSVNGTLLLKNFYKGLTFRQKTPLRGKRLFYSGQGFVLGRTFLRVYASDHRLGPTQVMSPWESVDHTLGRWYVAMSGLLVFFCLSLYNSFLSLPRTDRLMQGALSIGTLVLSCLAVAAVCSFVGRLLRHDTKFFVYVSLGFWCLSLLLAIDMVLSILSFNFNLWESIVWIEKLAFALVMFVSVYLVLFFATHLGHYLRLALAAILPVGILLAYIVGLATAPDFRSRPNYNHGLVAPKWQWIEPTPVARFVESSGFVYDEARESAQELADEAE